MFSRNPKFETKLGILAKRGKKHIHALTSLCELLMQATRENTFEKFSTEISLFLMNLPKSIQNPKKHGKPLQSSNTFLEKSTMK